MLVCGVRSPGPHVQRVIGTFFHYSSVGRAEVAKPYKRELWVSTWLSLNFTLIPLNYVAAVTVFISWRRRCKAIGLLEFVVAVHFCRLTEFLSRHSCSVLGSLFFRLCHSWTFLLSFLLQPNHAGRARKSLILWNLYVNNWPTFFVIL